MQWTGKRGAGAFEMVACAVQSSSSRILGQFWGFFFLFFFFLHCVKLYQDTMNEECNFIPVGCIELPLSHILYGEMDDVSA